MSTPNPPPRDSVECQHAYLDMEYKLCLSIIHEVRWNTLKDHEGILNHLQADIICFQEMKTSRAGLPKTIALPPSFDGFFSFPVRKSGYSGVATYTRSSLLVPHKAEEGLSSVIQPKPPLSSSERVSRPSAYPDAVLPTEDADTLDFKDLDSEGRVIVVDLGLFVLINVYCPNDGNGTEERDKYKMDFHKVLSARVKGLVEVEGREVVVVGDLNACAAVEDHCEGPLYVRRGLAEGKKGEEGFWAKDVRRWLRDWLIQEDEHANAAGGGCMIDIVRRYWPDRAEMYTCWNTKISARDSNYGTRIDYILVTKGLLPWVKAANIQPEIKGSDHCPVYMDLHDEITSESGEVVKLVDMLRVSKHESTSQPKAIPTNVPLPPPPRLAARCWDEYSGKQKMLDTFFRKKSGGDPPPTPSSSQGTVPSSSQPQYQSQSQSSSKGSTVPPLSQTPSQPQVIEPSSPVEMHGILMEDNPFPQSLADTLCQAFAASATPSDDMTDSPPPAPRIKRKLTATPSLQPSSSAKKLKPEPPAPAPVPKPHPKEKDEGGGESSSASSKKGKKPNGQTKLSTFFAKPKLGSSSQEDNKPSAPPPPPPSSQTTKGKAKAKAIPAKHGKAGVETNLTKGKGKSKVSSSIPLTTTQRSTQSSARGSSRVDLTLLSDSDDDLGGYGPAACQFVTAQDLGVDVNMEVEVEVDGDTGATASASEGESDYEFALRLAQDEDEDGDMEPPPSSLPLKPLATKTPSSSQSGSQGDGTKAKDPVKAWTTLMTRIEPPKCIVHGEPAKEHTVMKPGPNKGRAFFTCSRPVGPGYDAGRDYRRREEVDPQYKCNFFKWASDVRTEMTKAKAKQKGS